MAVISGGILECRPFSDKRALCGGQNFLSHRVGGRNSIRGYSSSNNNDGSLHSYKKNVREKRTRRREDVVLPSHIDKRAMRWRLPLFGWSQADQERWADNGINDWKTKGMDNSSEDDENEMEGAAVPSDSKFVRGRFTPEKAKLLRKNLRDTSTFHDIMYHSAIASRLASSDNGGNGF